jgi:hypothetical protein
MQPLQYYVKKMDRNQWMATIAVIGIIVVGGLLYANQKGLLAKYHFPSFMGGSDNAIAQKAVDYINNNQLAQSTATLVAGSVTESSGLVKFKISISGNAFDSYATKDGTLLFPQAFDLTASSKTTTGSTTPATTTTTKPADIKKVATPSLTAFVVSSCPFGLQMQRAMDAAITAIPQLASYLKVEYIGNVDSNGTILDSMHGTYEAAENLRQICIRDQQPAKYWAYTACYMQKTLGTDPATSMPYGDSVTCQKQAGVNVAQLNSCVSGGAGITAAKKDFADDTAYGVSGSPTLVLDGTQVSEFDFGGRDPEAIKEIVCAAMTTPASWCSQKIDTTQAATSFSLTYADASGAASTSAANCNTTAQ